IAAEHLLPVLAAVGGLPDAIAAAETGDIDGGGIGLGHCQETVAAGVLLWFQWRWLEGQAAIMGGKDTVPTGDVATGDAGPGVGGSGESPEVLVQPLALFCPG